MAVGLAVLGLDPLSLVLGNPQVTVDTFVVHREHRRCGAGARLLAAAAAYARENGAAHVVAAVGGHEAERQRFFARMGFAPLTTRRIVAVDSLVRSLAPGSAAACRSSRSDGRWDAAVRSSGRCPRWARWRPKPTAGPTRQAGRIMQVSRALAVVLASSSDTSMRKVASVRPRRTGVQTAVTTPDVAAFT